MKPLVLRNRRASPEADLQKHVATMLHAYLPAAIWWTSSLSGVRLPPAVAAAAKAAGMNRGAPDISAILPDGATVYLELKAPGGSLTPEQKILRDILGTSFAVCRSWEDVKVAFTEWMTPFGLDWLSERASLQRSAGRAA